MNKYLCAVGTGAILLAFSSVNALAGYACVGNVCWMAKEKYTYPADSKVVVREDTWKPGPDITIREAGPGRGYYAGGTWTTW
jgi:hypothetical protein